MWGSFILGKQLFLGSRELIKQEEKVARLHLQSEDVKADTAFAAQGSALRQRFLASMAPKAFPNPTKVEVVSLKTGNE